MSVLRHCGKCRSLLGPWEVHRGGCACRGPASQTHRDTLYAVACTVEKPLPVHDLLRLAYQDHGAVMNKTTALATLAPDPRFCWSGPGTYGLYRHGILPGPRNLEEVARLVLTAAGDLDMDAVDFVLKQLGYRFAVGSLRNAIGRSQVITWRGYWWSHPQGDQARQLVRQDIAVVPERQRAEFDEIIVRLERQVEKHLATRESRLSSISNIAVTLQALDWAQG